MNIRSRAAMLQMLGSMFVRVLLVDRADRTDDTKTSVLIAVMHIMYDNLKNQCVIAVCIVKATNSVTVFMHLNFAKKDETQNTKSWMI